MTRSTSDQDADAEAGTTTFYVGLGDQFDDDRRLVRETMRASPADDPHRGWRRTLRSLPTQNSPFILRTRLDIR